MNRCKYVEREKNKNRLCVRCKHFVCRYCYGFAREDAGYITIFCEVKVESAVKNVGGERGLELKWGLTDNVGWDTKDFQEEIERAKDCGFYEEI